MATRKNRRGGGSGGQPLSWVDPSAYEPSAPAGQNSLGVQGNIVRPALPVKMGGFIPSAMGGLAQSGSVLLVPAIAAARRLMNSNKTRKLRRGGGKMNDYRIDFEKAKRNLKQYIPEGQKGAPAKNIQALVAVRRGTSKKFKSEAEMITDFRQRMGARGAPKAKAPRPEGPGLAPMTRAEEWAAYKALATAQLKNVVKTPRQANVLKLAGILRSDQEPEEYLAEVRGRVAKAVNVAKTPKTPGKRATWESQKKEAREMLEEVLSSPQRKEILALAKILKEGNDPKPFLETIGAPEPAASTRRSPRTIAKTAAATPAPTTKKPNGRAVWGQTLKTARKRLMERVPNPKRENVYRVAKSLAQEVELEPILNEIGANYVPANRPLSGRSRMIPYEEGAPLPATFLNKKDKKVKIRNTPNVRLISPPSSTRKSASMDLTALKKKLAAEREQRVLEKMAQYSDEE